MNLMRKVNVVLAAHTNPATGPPTCESGPVAGAGKHPRLCQRVGQCQVRQPLFQALQPRQGLGTVKQTLVGQPVALWKLRAVTGL
jgi:hypothetical protein